MKKLILSILVCFILSIPTKSHSFSGKSWLDLCEGSVGSNKLASGEISCLSFLAGVKQMEESWSGFKNFEKLGRRTGPGNGFCIPKEVEMTQLKLVMIKWYKDHPEKLHQAFSVSYLFAMLENFPCDDSVYKE